VDKYTWVDVGSSYLPGEIISAFLAAQLDEAESIMTRRLALWDRYHAWAEPYERSGRLRRPVVPAHCVHNAHMYYLLLDDLADRTHFIESLKAKDIGAVFHYIPLHSSPAGLKYGRAHGALTQTDSLSERLVRMPLWVGLEPHLALVFEAADAALAR